MSIKRGVNELSNCKTIAIANQKGGVGKTTTALNLAYAIAENNKRVLLVDFDSQSNLTMCLGIDQPDNLETTIARLMMLEIDDEPLPGKNEYVLSFGKLDLIPSNIELSAVDVNLGFPNVIDRDRVLNRILENMKTDYDYIIIDCGPTLGLLLTNALAACDSVIIPVQSQFLSAKGLSYLLKSVDRVKKHGNTKIKCDGILITMFDKRTNLANNLYDEIKKGCAKRNVRVFNSIIPASVKVGESNLNSKSVIEYDPRSKVALAYKDFGKEYLGYGE